MNRPIMKSRNIGDVVFIGIDPGLTGAIAAIHSIRGFMGVKDMPTMANGKGNSKIKQQVDPADLALTLAEFSSVGAYHIIALERISSMPGQGVASMFSMGDTFGACRAVVACGGYMLEIITPQQWKKFYNIGKDNKKEVARAKAIQLYPSADLARKKDHNRAEAILIAHYLMKISK